MFPEDWGKNGECYEKFLISLSTRCPARTWELGVRLKSPKFPIDAHGSNTDISYSNETAQIEDQQGVLKEFTHNVPGGYPEYMRTNVRQMDQWMKLDLPISRIMCKR